MEAEAAAFGARIGGIVNDSFLCLAMGIGYKLKLFDAIGELATDEATAVTSQAIADKTGLRERYIREWLGAVVCGHIVDCTADGKRFWIQPARLPSLIQGTKSAMGYGSFLSVFGHVSDDIVGCFKPDGPTGLGYDHYGNFYDFMSNISTQRTNDHLIQDFLPLIPGMKDKLEAGAKYLDLGCGVGVPSAVIAKTFPKSESWGIDFTPDAIKRANARATVDGLANLHYREMDASKLSPEWTHQFDFVTAFDAIHDQGHPDRCLKDVVRVLKPGGTFAMFDINGTSNIAKDRDSIQSGGNPMPTMCYSISLLHCMTVSLNAPEGLGLGAMWGVEKAKEMLTTAGFADVTFHKLPFDPFNILFVCTTPK